MEEDETGSQLAICRALKLKNVATEEPTTEVIDEKGKNWILPNLSGYVGKRTPFGEKKRLKRRNW